ncbi:MAG: WhiB family transcriptional regulator [Nitriliruptor sp.]|uniref:WhiB family transcriptional regulator n=1 Tax=Nitriliruptor sp. TaxID=2448056 RepID=UPI0034A0163E
MRERNEMMDRIAELVAARAEDAWERGARCRTEDPVLFFGPNRFEPKRERLAREARAKAVCAGCPALEACREHAIAEGELYGVWGGLGEADRRTLVAREQRPMPRSA